MHGPGVELAISRSQVRRPNHYTTEPLRTQQLPLFALLEMVLRLSHQRRGDVELATVVLPRLEVEKTILVVEWKPRDVDRTV